MPTVAQGSEASGDSRKLASRTAELILADVVARGWPVGEVVGSEPELLERYGVSRAVFREAIRIVEHQQVAWMRRGPSGGLVVAEPSISSVIDAVIVYLFYTDARLDEVFEARTILEESAAEIATSRLTDDDVVVLRSLATDDAAPGSDARRLHSALARMSANPAIELFVEMLTRVTYFYLSDRRLVGPAIRTEAATAHRQIINAVLSGDGGRARRRMRRHLDAEAAFIRKRRTSRQALVPESAAEVSDRAKRAERLSREILADVVEQGWPVGESLGSEAELMEKYDASRAVFREAVRLLEHHQIATMRRGRGGGLLIVEPGVTAIADTAALYLEHRGIDAAALAETRLIIELAVIELAVQRLDDPGRAMLAEALELESLTQGREFSDAAHDVHVVLADVAGNRVLGLIVRVLARLTKLHQTADNRSPSAISDVPADVIRAHQGLVEAVLAGDEQLARHRQRRHLDALAAWLR